MAGVFGIVYFLFIMLPLEFNRIASKSKAIRCMKGGSLLIYFVTNFLVACKRTTSLFSSRKAKVEIKPEPPAKRWAFHSLDKSDFQALCLQNVRVLRANQHTFYYDDQTHQHRYDGRV